MVEILEQITKILKDVHNELREHEQKWFSSWRYPNTDEAMLSLKKKVSLFFYEIFNIFNIVFLFLKVIVLDKRVDLLLKV